MEEKKRRLIEALNKTHGLITLACKNAGVTRQTYYNWLNSDDEFKEEALEIEEMQKDFVESKLLENINANDPTSIIFYLKTKARERGYGAQPAKNLTSQKQLENKAAEQEFLKKVNSKKNWIIKVLKDQNKYTPELSTQAKLTATLMVKVEMLSDQIAVEGSVNVEVSREGNERQSVSAKERLFMAYSKQLQYALRALGMNTDSHAQIGNEDSGIDEFITALNDSVE
ncbi:MAG: hypothetical protein LKE41_01050 [Prevotella sp.]|jgi:hypothetical protein|nr:hypothetical protein [Prevotella sp.]